MAVVRFTLEEWQRFYGGWIGRDDATDAEGREVYELLETARRGRDALEEANDFLDGFGIESLFERDGRIVTDPWDSRLLMDYINAGDTYNETLFYDRAEDAFYLGSYGDFIEAWEAEHPQLDLCQECGEYAPIEELDNEDGLCEACRTRRDPLWVPGTNDTEIAVLRTVDGELIHVHVLENNPDNLAFSVAVGDAFSALSPGLPHAYPWWMIVEAMHEGSISGSVFGSEGLDRDQLERLTVARDAYIDGHTPDEFLRAPKKT